MRPCRQSKNTTHLDFRGRLCVELLSPPLPSMASAVWYFLLKRRTEENSRAHAQTHTHTCNLMHRCTDVQKRGYKNAPSLRPPNFCATVTLRHRRLLAQISFGAMRHGTQESKLVFDSLCLTPPYHFRWTLAQRCQPSSQIKLWKRRRPEWTCRQAETMPSELLKIWASP